MRCNSACSTWGFVLSLAIALVMSICSALPAPGTELGLHMSSLGSGVESGVEEAPVSSAKWAWSKNIATPASTSQQVEARATTANNNTKLDSNSHSNSDTPKITTYSGRRIGHASVENACAFAVNSNIVHAPRPGAEGPPEEIYEILLPGARQTHPFVHDPSMGVSWKLWRTDVENTAPVQLEYTWIPEARRTWYDLSMIDAGEAEALEGSGVEAPVPDADGYGEYRGSIGIRHAFTDGGMSLSPDLEGQDQDTAAGNCVRVGCVPGEAYCAGAYNTWNDWGQQHDCGEGVDLKLVLCG